jgi:hypothetical protein
VYGALNHSNISQGLRRRRVPNPYTGGTRSTPHRYASSSCPTLHPTAAIPRVQVEPPVSPGPYMHVPPTLAISTLTMRGIKKSLSLHFHIAMSLIGIPEDA